MDGTAPVVIAEHEWWHISDRVPAAGQRILIWAFGDRLSMFLGTYDAKEGRAYTVGLYYGGGVTLSGRSFWYTEV